MSVITRFAPSPTGYLHIGGARTALFNYLFAKHHQGLFLLRIEDTDRERSTNQATEAIFASLEWLGIKWDKEPIFQFARNELHRSAALELLKAGKAYYCFTAAEEIDRQRQQAIEAKQHFIFRSPWRDADPATYPLNVKPVVRLKVPEEGSVVIRDKLQGDIIIDNSHLDDMVLLRSDGSATYMLAVVVDDHDMKITHIIRGDDHLTNAARQIALYNAFGWSVPVMVHIPLILGTDGEKLSKRHGALGVEGYREMGYLPEALCNYLLRLGWGHGDDEIISREQAIEWFDIDGLGKSPARLDFAKMNNLNAHYLRQLDNELLTSKVVDLLAPDHLVTSLERDYIKAGMDGLKTRAELLTDLANLGKIYLTKPIEYGEEAKIIIKNCNKNHLQQAIIALERIEEFNKDKIQDALKAVAQHNNIKLGELMQPIRVLMTGSTASPGVFEIISILGLENTIKRLRYYSNIIT